MHTLIIINILIQALKDNADQYRLYILIPCIIYQDREYKEMQSNIENYGNTKQYVMISSKITVS